MCKHIVYMSVDLQESFFLVLKCLILNCGKNRKLLFLFVSFSFPEIITPENNSIVDCASKRDEKAKNVYKSRGKECEQSNGWIRCVPTLESVGFGYCCIYKGHLALWNDRLLCRRCEYISISYDIVSFKYCCLHIALPTLYTFIADKMLKKKKKNVNKRKQQKRNKKMNT